jgi:hypothetical protein
MISMTCEAGGAFRKEGGHAFPEVVAQVARGHQIVR